MSVKIMSAVFESETLGPTERLIMLALADHADDAGRCYPSISRLCSRTGLAQRTVQTNIRKLQDQGYIRIIPSAGQGGANLYFVTATPAADAPPQEVRPRSRCTTPLHMTALTPAADAPKPSRTIIEPSVSNPARESPVDILAEVASSKAAASFVAFRQKIKKPLTATGAKRLCKSLFEIRDQGGDPDDALGMAEERGWQAIKPEWYFKDQQNVQSPRPSRADTNADTLRYALNVAGRARPSPEPGWL